MTIDDFLKKIPKPTKNEIAELDSWEWMYSDRFVSHMEKFPEFFPLKENEDAGEQPEFKKLVDYLERNFQKYFPDEDLYGALVDLFGSNGW